MVLFAGICYENVIVAEAAGTTDVDVSTFVQLFGYHNYREDNCPSHYYVSFCVPDLVSHEINFVWSSFR